MTSWICYSCGSYNVFETMLVRINRLACILDDAEDVRKIDDAHAWCEDCHERVEIIKAEQPLYAKI